MKRSSMKRLKTIGRLIAAACSMAAAAAAPQAWAQAQAQGQAQGTDPLSALLVGGRGLTSDEVARRASATSVEAKVKERGVAVAEARQDEAQAGYWPRLTGTARYTRQSAVPPIEFADPRFPFVVRPGAPGAVLPGDALIAVGFPPFAVPVNQYLFQASLTVPISDYVTRVSQGIAAATHSVRAARIDEQAARLRVAADARAAYYQWIRARGQALIAVQALEQARGHLRDAQQMFGAGLVSRADTLRAESQVKSTELLVTRTENFVALAEEQLHIVMHDPGTARYEIGEDIVAPLPALGDLARNPRRVPDLPRWAPAAQPPTPDAGELARLQDEAFDKRLELRALEETAGSAHELVKVARAARYPRIDLAGNAIYANPNPRIFPAQEKYDGTWDASVVLSWTPTDIPGARAAGRGREAEESQIAAQREALLDGVRLEVTQAWQAAREAEVAIGTTQQGLRAAEEGYRVRRDLFRNGKATLIEVDDSQNELTRARLEIVNAHIDARIARVRLTHAVGRDTEAARRN
jgi:outer membrane protein TolC